MKTYDTVLFKLNLTRDTLSYGVVRDLLRKPSRKNFKNLLYVLDSLKLYHSEVALQGILPYARSVLHTWPKDYCKIDRSFISKDVDSLAHCVEAKSLKVFNKVLEGSYPNLEELVLAENLKIGPSKISQVWIPLICIRTSTLSKIKIKKLTNILQRFPQTTQFELWHGDSNPPSVAPILGLKVGQATLVKCVFDKESVPYRSRF
jgi:hypothetical protein